MFLSGLDESPRDSVVDELLPGMALNSVSGVMELENVGNDKLIQSTMRAVFVNFWKYMLFVLK